MQILITDRNWEHADMINICMRIAIPSAKCYVCTHPVYLEDFMELFKFDGVLIGSFGEMMTREELVRTIQGYDDHIQIVHYHSTPVNTHSERLGNAVVKINEGMEEAVHVLKTIFDHQ